MTAVDLMVFTCEGREHLLRGTMQSLATAVNYPFAARRVMVDGPVAAAALECVGADAIVQHPSRRGYVRAILTALRQVEAKYFFWLEDDWRFEAPVDVAALVTAMDANPEWAQVRLSKTGPLTEAEKEWPLGGGIYESIVGFSANPCLCRTAVMRQAFDALALSPRGNTPGVDGFENFVTRWCVERGLVCAVLDGPGVSHDGYLESTPREWHMTASLDGAPDEPVLSMGGPPPSWRRALMVAKLGRRFAEVAVRQLSDDHAYELAFRMVNAPLPARDTEEAQP